MRIIGVDPGLRRLGWGVIEARGSRLAHVAHGVLSTDGADLAARLLALHAGLSQVLEAQAPGAAAIEQTFVNRDGAGTLKLGQARGVALLALAQAGLVPGEYAPNAVKKAVVGAGHADKRQIGYMIGLHFPGLGAVPADAADALAVAVAHAHLGQAQGRLAAAVARAEAGR